MKIISIRELHEKTGVWIREDAENGFKEIYSYVRQLLSAAGDFGLRGINHI
jgi:hypothetical protein